MNTSCPKRWKMGMIDSFLEGGQSLYSNWRFLGVRLHSLPPEMQLSAILTSLLSR